ncbi:Uncharacterized conserved protein, DUF2147 family [Thalassococcus halodurans]|uniref:Uncharacterized conserved protein, DUF2147 family n=1 Tax=Thalassococcus halodurans TaxID=373675 RepID=A0A1H5ZR16_9RHOB|nr:DUF2147 domain-containing protein [Thalassococcus halodurans]SEG38651.1 Uncharacterized conserved protein, DUF2147 family [Thalassococcus halodurans]
MKKFLGIVMGLVLAASAATADPIKGTWKTEVDDGSYAHIGLKSCGDKICGTIDKTFNSSGEYQSPNLGKVLVINMEPQGGGKYEGKVWRPSNNKIYMGKMTLSGNKLKLQGCVAGGLLCSSQNWTRVN